VRVRRGIALMIASSALFAAMAVMVKALREAIPTQEIVFFRSLLNVAFTVVLALRYGAPLLGSRKASLFLRGAFGYAALSLHFYALTHLPLSDAIVLHNTAPLLVALLAPLVLGEATSPRTLAISATGLLGTALIVRPTGDVGLWAGTAALGGALMSACAYVTIRGIGKTEHPLTVVLYFPLTALLGSAVPTAQDFVAPDAREALLLLGIGATTTSAQIALTSALQREKAADASAAAYTGIAFTMLFGAVALGEIPDARSFAGAAVVVGAALLVARDSSTAASETPTPGGSPGIAPVAESRARGPAQEIG